MERKIVRLLKDRKFDDAILNNVRELESKNLDDVKYIEVTNEGLLFCTYDKIIGGIAYHQIKYVNFSMCSRYSGGFGSASRFGGIQVDVNIDVDIALEMQTILLEIEKPTHLQALIDILKERQVECIDMVGVIDLYQQYPDEEKRNKYLLVHFNEIAKKYRLDHPRFKSRFRK